MSLVLARLLAPEDFGTYAIGLLYLQIAIICNDVGVTSALVQWRGSFQDIIPTARTITYLTTLVVTTALVVGADGLARFSGNPNAAPVILILALSVLLDGAMAVSTAQMWREFKQGQFVLASLAGFLAQVSVAVSVAFAGGGALSFALGMAADAVVRFVLVSAFSRTSFAPGLDWSVARRLVIFGIPLASGLGVQAILLNIDYLVIGRLLDATQLGFYTIAFNISGWIPGLLGTALGSVTLAGFARLAEEGADALSRAVRKALTLLTKVLLPLVAILSVCAPKLIQTAYGDRWIPAAFALTWLSIYMIPRMLAQTATEVLVAQGRTRWPVLANISWLVALVPCLILGTHLAGIEGAAIAQAAVGCVVALPLMLIALRRSGIDLSGLVQGLIRPLLGAVAASFLGAIVAYLFSTDGIVIQIVALVASAFTIIVAFLVLGLNRDERRFLLARCAAITRLHRREQGGAT